jgi:hypothetical protein
MEIAYLYFVGRKVFAALAALATGVGCKSVRDQLDVTETVGAVSANAEAALTERKLASTVCDSEYSARTAYHPTGRERVPAI